jgi:uncharacterized membrane protein
MYYTLLVFLGVVLYGIAAFTRKLSVEQINPYQIQLISCIVHAVLIPILMYLAPNNKNFNTYSVGMASLTTLLGIGGGLAFSYLLRGNANAGVVSALLGISPVVTIALSYFFYHDTISVWKCFAFFFAILSVIMVNY